VQHVEAGQKSDDNGIAAAEVTAQHNKAQVQIVFVQSVRYLMCVRLEAGLNSILIVA
jgi:hypothetical protein